MAFNKTHLSLDNMEKPTGGQIHRDYIAHCFRWTHAVQALHKGGRYKSDIVLDVGCGREQPLARVLYKNMILPLHYHGVDINKLTAGEAIKNSKRKWFTLHGETDFLTFEPDFEPTVVTSFECLEHVPPGHARAMVQHMHDLLTDDPKGVGFISTPCHDFKVGAAKDHPNEMTYEAFGSMLEECGWRIEAHWGTFASIKDYKKHMTDAQIELWEKLKEYYDSSIISVMFAPLFPQHSRNVIWRLRKNSDLPRLFKPLDEIEGPWGNSPDWEEMNGK